MLIRITEEENIKLATTKFGKKAIGLWKSFQMFDKHPPYAWKVDDQIVAICHITFSPRTKYCNLYYIEALVPHQGYGQALYDSLVSHFQELGIQRIKLSAEPEAINFWFKKNHFWFFSYDKYGSLKADMPLVSRWVAETIKREHLDVYVINKSIVWESIMPPDTKHLQPPENISEKALAKAKASIELVKPYYFQYMIEQNNLDPWM